jgi:dihydrofolate reductase
MGRKTWDSIPERFRPLKGRLNVVISRSHSSDSAKGIVDIDKEQLKSPSLKEALAALSRREGMSKLFVIGGAEIYKTALETKESKRILLTRILNDFECDTFFPVELDEVHGGEWKKTTKEELDDWVGETVPNGVQEENGVKYVFEMYERN